MSHTELDLKVSILKSKVDEGLFQYADTFNYDERWEEIGTLISEIHEEFKSVRYPTRNERTEAWNNFAELREGVYGQKRNEFEKMSTAHFWRLDHLINNATYSALEELFLGIISAGIIKETADSLKEMKQLLWEAIEEFNKVKHQMTKEHKNDTQEKINHAKESHKQGWERIDGAKRDEREARLEKNKGSRDRTEKAKQNKEDNIERSRAKIDKAKEALERAKESLADLEEKISESYNDNWKEKAEGWKEEKESKIRDIESSIERMEGWIEEDEKAISEMEEYIAKLDKWIEEDESKL